MPADNKTLQPASKRASQHASPISGVTDSTGFLRGQQVNNVGWVGLGLVHEAARRASLIMSSTDNVQASYNYILTFLAFTREFRSFYTFSGLNASYLFICSSLHCTFSLFQHKALLSRVMYSIGFLLQLLTVRRNHVCKVSRWTFRVHGFAAGFEFPIFYWFLHGCYKNSACDVGLGHNVVTFLYLPLSTSSQLQQITQFLSVFCHAVFYLRIIRVVQS